MVTEEEIIFQSDSEIKDIESIRKNFEGQMYLDSFYDPAFKALFDSEYALKDFLDEVFAGPFLSQWNPLKITMF